MAGQRDYQVYAIASRSLEKAQDAATKLAIPKAYGSYDDLIADPEIDIIYNPLPNHLHVPYTLKMHRSRKACFMRKALSPYCSGGGSTYRCQGQI